MLVIWNIYNEDNHSFIYHIEDNDDQKQSHTGDICLA